MANLKYHFIYRANPAPPPPPYTGYLLRPLHLTVTFFLHFFFSISRGLQRACNLSFLAAAGEDRQGGGTFGYTAPEVIFGTRPAHESQDAWAVGHMILVVLTKRRYRTSNMFKHSVSSVLYHLSLSCCWLQK